MQWSYILLQTDRKFLHLSAQYHIYRIIIIIIIVASFSLVWIHSFLTFSFPVVCLVDFPFVRHLRFRSVAVVASLTRSLLLFHS